MTKLYVPQTRTARVQRARRKHKHQNAERRQPKPIKETRDPPAGYSRIHYQKLAIILDATD